jgi:hypothetical protein
MVPIWRPMKIHGFGDIPLIPQAANFYASMYYSIELNKVINEKQAFF